jgi:hypothetical protein
MNFRKSMPLLFILASLTLATLFAYENGGPKYNIYLEAPCLTGVLHGDPWSVSGDMHSNTVPGGSSIYSLDSGVVANVSFQPAEIPEVGTIVFSESARKHHTGPEEPKRDLITFNITNKSPPYRLL